MAFLQPESVPLLLCPDCLCVGYRGWRTCATCRGMGAGVGRRTQWLYFGYPLERYHLGLAHARRLFNWLRKATFFLLGATAWAWAWFGLSASRSIRLGVWSSYPPSSRVLFLFGAVAFLYLLYRCVVEAEHFADVEHFDYTGGEAGERYAALSEWSGARRLKRGKRNIAKTFTAEALLAVGSAYNVADASGVNTVTPAHLLLALFKFNRIHNLFIRLGVSVRSLEEQVLALANHQNSLTGGRHSAPRVSRELYEILFLAYEEAYRAHQSYVSVTELLVAAVKQLPAVQDMLFDLTIDEKKLTNVAEWVRIRERLHRNYQRFRRAARHRSKHGMDRAMTAVATPFLNQFSEDVTLAAQMGYTDMCVGRDKELTTLFQIVEGGQQNVLLVGDYGTGKKSMVEGLAGRMVEDDVPKRLQDKRLVRLSISSLLAGTTPSGAVQRLQGIMYEVSRAGNIILCIHNIQELMGVSAGSKDSLDVGSSLADYLTNGRFITIATTTPEAYSQHIAQSKLSTVFAKVDVAEMDEDQAIQVLESKVGAVEYKQQVFFAYDALAKAVALSKKFIREVTLPGSALEVMSEAAAVARNRKGANTLVTGEEVATVVSEKTKIPLNTITSDETQKLLHLEEAMHERVVGQNEAVTLVANALRRARAEIRAANRPIANFLFLGPTGVGKTELAKTIAQVYFGGEERSLRFDMSEYQDKSSLFRLIGTPGEKGSGVFTEAVRRKPFSLVLLDEIEKADTDILNLFLQVMDDGRISDSTGRSVDCTNIILIATSNAGTSYVAEAHKQGLSNEAIKERLLHGELKEHFKPEFLNRFDGIVLFEPLNTESIRQIAGLMLARVAKDLEVKGINLKVEDAALDYFATIGFDPEFGARPLRRALQETVENQLASFILSGAVKRRDTIVVGKDGVLSLG